MPNGRRKAEGGGVRGRRREGRMRRKEGRKEERGALEWEGKKNGREWEQEKEE